MHKIWHEAGTGEEERLANILDVTKLFYSPVVLDIILRQWMMQVLSQSRKSSKMPNYCHSLFQKWNRQKEDFFFFKQAESESLKNKNRNQFRVFSKIC